MLLNCAELSMPESAQVFALTVRQLSAYELICGFEGCSHLLPTLTRHDHLS